MAIIVNSKNVTINCDVQIRKKKILLTGGKNIGSIPTLYDINSDYVEVVNSWFLHLAPDKKNLNSYQRALLLYWRYLESSQLSWDHFPGIKSKKPTYKFRQEVLIKRVNDGTLARSTANTYIGHIVQFYKWAIHQRYLIIRDELCAPFQIEFVEISRDDAFAHMLPKFTVDTTDLRIRVTKNATTKTVRGLKPLSVESIELVKSELYKESIEFQLILMLVLLCGLRIEEACTFSMAALKQAIPNETRTVYEIVIAPEVGVCTKFNKDRTILMSADLYNALNDYFFSERRLKRVTKLEEKYENSDEHSMNNEDEIDLKKVESLERALTHDSIFISQQGNPFTTASMNTRWSQFRGHLKTLDPLFDHKLYDCRSSYATYYLKDLLDRGVAASDAIEEIMERLGHNDERTVWRYLKLIRRKELHIEKIGILDQIMHEAISAYSEDSWL